MKIFKILSFGFITIAGILIACNKEAVNQQKKNTALNASQTSNAVAGACDLLAYPDSIFYLKPQYLHC